MDHVSGGGASQGTLQMVFIRLATGVKTHFAVRYTEWVMLVPTFGMWMAFSAQPDMFEVSNSYARISAVADESTWATFMLICGIARVFALVVNGTFDEFKYSAHIRMLASALGAVFWSHLSMGFLQAYLNDGGGASAVVMYTFPVVCELGNFFRSSKDIGITYSETKKRRRNGMGN